MAIGKKTVAIGVNVICAVYLSEFTEDVVICSEGNKSDLGSLAKPGKVNNPNRNIMTRVNSII